MSGVEAAASLFGSEETGSDLFAVLGTEETQRSGHDLLDNQNTTSSNAEFLNPTQHGGPPLNNEAATWDVSQSHTQHEPTSDHSNSSTSLGSGSTGQQGWYEQSQSQNYVPNFDTPAPEAHPPPQQQYSTNRDSHGSYFPTQNSFVSPSNAPATAQSPYNPYIPSQPSANHLPPRPTTSTTTPFNSHAYMPSSQVEPTSQFTSPYASSSHIAHTVPGQGTSTSSQVTPPLLTSPPLPPPTVRTVIRPKVSNAYDPPFPTTAKANRRTGRVGSGQGTYGYNAYGSTPNNAYTPSTQSTIQSLPPPPPQRISSPVLPSDEPRPPQPLSASSPPMRSPSLPMQSTYGGYRDHIQGVAGTGDVTFHENEAEISARQRQKSSSRISLSPDKHYEPSSDGTQASNIGTTNPISYLADLSTDHNAPPAAGLAPELSSPGTVPFSNDLCLKSPHEHTLPPSPTTSQFGRSSPFTEPNTTRTLSPKPTEVLSGKTPGLSYRQTTDAHPYHQVHSSPVRSSSPSQAQITTTQSTHPGITNPYLPKLAMSEEESLLPANTQNGDLYAPKVLTNIYQGERIASPSPIPTKTIAGGHPMKSHPANPYAPVKVDPHSHPKSNGPALSASTSTEDSHIFLQNTARRLTEDEQGNQKPRYTYPNGHDAIAHSLAHEHHVQEVLLKPFQTPYAPSPSLLGSNDPLGRTARRPIFSFGFGGKLVTCFHGAASLNTGFDVALSARNSTGVHIRVLKNLIPESALDTTTTFPGPLYGDPTASTTSIVRSGTSSHAKTKKANVIKYLSEKTDELALGLRYLSPESIESRRAEGKLVLVKLLQLMVEHDGRLTGTPELDTAVRLALVPRLEGTFGANSFTTVADSQGALSSNFSSDMHEPAISITTLRASNLDKLQDFLLRGERRQAYHYALDEKLWAHAMVIASSIDKEAWKEVVNEFLRRELGTSTSSSAADSGRESLRVAYSLYSGQGTVAVQELAPPNLLARTAGRLQSQTALSHLTPKTPNFTTVLATTPSVPLETLSKWTETVAMILSNPLTTDTSVALTSLGDQLAANELYEAAHVCYLLAPQTSPLGGVGHPSARIVLVGSRNPQNFPGFFKDQDPIIFSEVVEFALSLAPPTKGQDAFSGIQHLQAYRFIRAMALVEIGDIKQANKYCEAITAAVNRGSLYATPALLEQLKGLSDRITGITHVDKSFWTGAKLSKPSLDSIGGWLEGRFTKLVTGDTDMDKLVEEESNNTKAADFAGPFSHYSTISSTTPSARSSPQPSAINANILPPARSGSAMANASPYVYQQIERASSAMDHARPKPSSAHHISSANASSTSFGTVPSFSQALENHKDHNGYSPSDDLVTPRPPLTSDNDENVVQHASWWSETAYAEGASTQTPIAPVFMRVDESTMPVPSSSEGFISLADSASYAIRPQTSNRSLAQTSHPDEEDEEDLGLGNAKKYTEEKAKVNETSGEHKAQQPSEETEPAPSPQSENKSTPAQRGWLSRWWWKSDTSAPIKANLGESSAFYYDKELKRWINKNASSTEEVKSGSTRPPSRAQTASPAMTGPRPPSSGSGPPPSRPASAIDLSTSPPSRTTMRVRSNLAPTPESAPSTPTGSRLTPTGPPPGRPKSQASKRNVRSRYVDILQQEGST